MSSEQHKIPYGFVQIGLALSVSDEQLREWEEVILPHLNTDHVVYYSKKEKFPGRKGIWTELSFYCQPQYESSVTYNIGIRAQAMFEYANRREMISVIGNKTPQERGNLKMLLTNSNTEMSNG